MYCRDSKQRYLALLWVELLEIYFDRQSGSRLAEGVGDGARYWRLIEAGLSMARQ